MKTSCIVSPAKDPFVVVRKSWVEICEGNHCAAMLLNFLVTNQLEEDMPQRYTFLDLSQGLLGIYSIKPIGKAITKLVDKGFISIHSNPEYQIDKAKHYLTYPDIIQVAIDTLESKKV